MVEAPIISQNIVGFLLKNYGPQWEIEFLRPAAGPLFERMIAYVVGYARLTSYSKQLHRGLCDTWSVEEKAERLRSLGSWAASSKSGKSLGSVDRRRPFGPRCPLYCLLL